MIWWWDWISILKTASEGEQWNVLSCTCRLCAFTPVRASCICQCWSSVFRTHTLLSQGLTDFFCSTKQSNCCGQCKKLHGLLHELLCDWNTHVRRNSFTAKERNRLAQNFQNRFSEDLKDHDPARIYISHSLKDKNGWEIQRMRDASARSILVKTQVLMKIVCVAVFAEKKRNFAIESVWMGCNALHSRIDKYFYKIKLVV